MMRSIRRWLLPAPLWLVPIAIACAPVSSRTDTPLPSATPTPTTAPSASPTPTATATAQPTPTPSPSPTPTVQPSPTPCGLPEGAAAEGTAEIGGRSVSLEIADTGDERSIGLSGRTCLPEDHGMLFVFSGGGNWGFWMLETLIPLDLVYLDDEGEVVTIHTMQPEPGVPPDDLTVYEPESPAWYAIELNAGAAERYDLQVGDRVALPDLE